MEIYTARKEDLLYTTYHLAAVPESAEFVDDAYVNNAGDLRTYSVEYAPMGTDAATAEYYDYVNLNYTQVPEDLRAELQKFLAETGWDLAATPEELATFVRNSAVYDLNTPRIPYGEDFVLYFLQQSKRGYCVHFATATVMLLRTMGIPARYVTGYSVSGTSGEWVTVTEDDAHAWVEYYVNGTGWIPLEPTPAVDETAYNAETEPEPDETPESQEPQTGETEELDPLQNEPKPTQQQVGTTDDRDSKGGAAHWLWLLVLPGASALIVLRRWLTLRRRQYRCTRGHPNRRAMALWRWLIRLARREGTSVEEELICLAEKARFSQHTLTEEELAQLQEALEQRISRLRQHSAGMQLWYRFGLILY